MESISTFLDTMLRELHRRHLKPLGFKKTRRTFSRDMGAYWERFNFQGSSWNYTGAEYWNYYINVGVEFRDLAPEPFWSYFAHTHWATRMEDLVQSDMNWGEYNLSTDRLALIDELARLIKAASLATAAKIPAIHEEYVAKKLGKPHA